MKPRLHPYVSEFNHARVRALAARPNETESSVVDRALTAFFTEAHDDQRDAVLLRRLDRLTRQFDRLEQKDTVLGETLALFVRYFLTVTPPLPPAHMDAARAKGEERFEAFLAQLGRDLQAGKRILQRAVDEALADETDFFTEDELSRLHQPAPERTKKRATEAADG